MPYTEVKNTNSHEETNHIPKALYNKIAENLPIASVEAIITANDGALLFMKRKNPPARDEWWLPGGRIHKGESLEQALRREIKEETGLEVTSCNLINVYTRVFPERHDITIVYRCRCKKGRVRLGNEHSEYRFFKNVPEGLHPYMQEVLDDAKELRRQKTTKNPENNNLKL